MSTLRWRAGRRTGGHRAPSRRIQRRRFPCNLPTSSGKLGPSAKDATMYAPPGVKTNANMPVPDTMRAWVLGDPGELSFTRKPVPIPRRAEVLVRIDAVAICATDLEVIAHGSPALVEG